jgi:hypothetical protein
MARRELAVLFLRIRIRIPECAWAFGLFFSGMVRVLRGLGRIFRRWLRFAVSLFLVLVCVFLRIVGDRESCCDGCEILGFA